MAGSPKDLAECLRSYAGDGTVEWVLEPMQSRVLSESARSIDEIAARIAELEEFARDLYEFAELYDEEIGPNQWCEIRERMQALGIEMK